MKMLRNKMSMPKNILFIDDEKDITFTIKIILEQTGLFFVDSFNDPDLALKRFKPNFYALVLIDIMMPKMDGFELYEQLKKIDPDVKVCFLTAREMYHHGVMEVKHCALNEDLFLQKPISNENLVREIDKKINGSRIRLNTKQNLLKEKEIVAFTH
ncbi:MAG: response regulator [Nitrososphaeraceae archaeon]|jgi:DNA-binding NtrC family response regulator